MSAPAKLALAILCALAALPAGAGAELITPHTVKPTVLTPQTVPPSTPTPAAPSPLPSPTPAPAPPSTPGTLPPGPLLPQDPGTGLRPTWAPSSKPGWEGVKETHDAIEHDLGGNLLNQAVTDIMQFEAATILVYDVLINSGFLPPMEGPGYINSKTLILHGDPNINVDPKFTDQSGDPDQGEDADLSTPHGLDEGINTGRWDHDVNGADPGEIRELIDGVFGTNATELPPKKEQ